MIIEIEWSEALNGYRYDFYKDARAFESGDNDDGGCCTGSKNEAIEMAMLQAMSKKKEKKEKKRKVVIEVEGGVADVTECPDDVEVEIIDHDDY